MPYIGEIAALITSLSFAFTATFFTFGGKEVGSGIVNRTRLLLALILLVLIYLLLYKTPLPLDAAPDRWLYLGISGVIGLTLGDAFLFQAFLWIGPRISMLMMSLAPVIAALLAWIFLGESLRPGQIFGIMVTISGVAVVVTEQNQPSQRPLAVSSSQHSPEPEPQDRRNRVFGILFALGGATGQALGLVLSKQGLYGEFSAISGNLIRMLSATTVIWIFTVFRRQASVTFSRLREKPTGFWFILAGTLFGPVTGVSFSLLAVQNTSVGIASTLMALPPVLILPISYFVLKERFGWQALAGTLIAITGVALLFLL